MLAERLWADRLVDTHGADRALILIQDVAADPPHLVGHLVVPHPGGPLRRFLKLSRRLPPVPPQDHVQVHGAPPVMITVLPSVHPDLARFEDRETVAVGPPGSA